MKKVIGIAGCSRAGKDSLVKTLQLYLSSKGLEGKRVALADPLKHEIDDFLLLRFNISAFTTDLKEKEIIRPLLVAYGKSKRILTNGLYFTDLAQKIINANALYDYVYMISDIRYADFEQDELHWLKEINKGFLIHVERLDNNNKIIEAPNEDEKRNDPKLKENADYQLLWPSIDNGNPNTLITYLAENHSKLISKLDEFLK